MVERTATRHGLVGSNDDDVLTGIAQAGKTQIHVYAGAGDDLINLDFDEGGIYAFSHGHHARGDGDGQNDRGSDTFNFQNTDRVSNGNVIVGRLEDFDSRDRIMLEGVELDLHNLPSNVRIVEFNGNHDDSGASPQQWILITTSTGGYIFYALEGARVDMDGTGGANSGNQEGHFIQNHQVPNFSSLKDVKYVDPENYVPEGYAPNGGVVINDDDEDAADVQEQITGSSDGDLIAAGLNDDSVDAGDGNDRAWGGRGNDYLHGGDGKDRLEGGGGADTLRGARGDDRIDGNDGDDSQYGGSGDDRMYGNDGDDFLDGGSGDDSLMGGDGEDSLDGWRGNDRLDGRDGVDVLTGGDGDDTLHGGGDDDMLYGEGGNDRLYGSIGNDRLWGDDSWGDDGGDDTLLGAWGDDTLRGGAGRDEVDGGAGDDVFLFKTGDLLDIDDTSGPWLERVAEMDFILDFEIGNDRIHFHNFAGVESKSDLRAYRTDIDGNEYFQLIVRDTNERVVVDVEDGTTWSEFMDADNFLIWAWA